jgi:hypothetical protein
MGPSHPFSLGMFKIHHLAGAFLLLASAASAQVCPSPTNSFWKNDHLPNNPQGPLTISVIPGLCEGEGAANVFTLLPGMPLQRVTQVVCPFGASSGANGFTASVNVQVFDGVSFSGPQNTPTLGPKVFDFAADLGSSLQVTSTGLNVFDLTQYNVVVGQSGLGNFVVAFTMEFNPNGNCASGFNANFFTDNTQFGFQCDANITPPKTSLMNILGQGWVDVSKATVTGIPICPFFFAGIWAIRACTENAGPVNPLFVTASPTQIPFGSFSSLTFHAPGYEGSVYLAGAAFNTTPGLPTPYGVVPLANDVLLNLSLNTPSVFVNFSGVIGAAGTAPGLILVPNNPGYAGLSFWVAFVAIPQNGDPWGLSDPLQLTVQ